MKQTSSPPIQENWKDLDVQVQVLGQMGPQIVAPDHPTSNFERPMVQKRVRSKGVCDPPPQLCDPQTGCTSSPPPVVEQGLGQLGREVIDEGHRSPGPPLTLPQRVSPEVNGPTWGHSEEENVIQGGGLEPSLAGAMVQLPQPMGPAFLVESVTAPGVTREVGSGVLGWLYGVFIGSGGSVSPSSSGNFGGDVFYTPLGSSGTPTLGGDGEISADIPSPRGCDTPPISANFVPISLAETSGTEKLPFSM